MSTSNHSQAWSTEVSLASVVAPDADTDESYRISTSCDALFGAQPGGAQFGPLDASHSPDAVSAGVPNPLTELCLPTAADIGIGIGAGTGTGTGAGAGTGTADFAISQGAENQGLDSWAFSLAADWDSGPFGIVSHSSILPPWTSDFSSCHARNDVLSHTLFTHGSHGIADWVDQEFPTLLPTFDPDSCSSGLGFHFELNSTDFTDSFLAIDPWSSPPWSTKFDLQDVSVKDLRCDWPQCSSLGVFNSIEEHKGHIKQHAQDVSNSWSPGRKCTWHKCSSKASHRSRNVFEAHLNNIHVNPLVCTVKHCKHKTPFRANHDLQRHIATAHNVDSKYTCPYASCAGRGFIRKDKWMSHLKEHHDTEPCPYAHCQRRTENIPPHQRSVSRHIGKSHSNFECALRSCKGKISRFAESQLLEHLELHHAMEWALVLKTRDTVKADGHRTLTSGHILQGVEVHDCKMCTESS